MTARRHSWQSNGVPAGLLGLCLVGGLGGCGGQAGTDHDAQNPEVAAQPAAQQGDGAGQKTRPAAVPLDPRLHQPFKEAVLLDPPTDSVSRPPDVTKAGKVVGKLFEAVAGNNNQGGLWDQVKFSTPAGKRLNYTATIKTDQGAATLELWPEVAPNHVRNFVALARAGYFDGLEIDRIHREKSVEDGTVLEYLEAGCPAGTGDYGLGSIGYWLLPELNEQIKHEPGTVGAWHAAELETAACKFYISLTKAPVMDGYFTVFGKVTGGLDVLRAVGKSPTRAEPGLQDRPQEPIVIRSVTIECRESDRASGPPN